MAAIGPVCATLTRLTQETGFLSLFLLAGERCPQPTAMIPFDFLGDPVWVHNFPHNLEAEKYNLKPSEPEHNETGGRVLSGSEPGT